MDLLLVLIRSVHIGCAVIAGGAAFYQFFILRPALAELDDATRAAVRDRMLRRWFPVVLSLVAALLITGFVNFFVYKIPQYRGNPHAGLYHGLLGVKILLALSVFHAATVLAIPGPRGDKWRAKAFWRAWPVVAIGLIVVIGAVLVNFARVFD